MSEDGYRDSPEWEAVVTAVQNLVTKSEEVNSRPGSSIMISDLEITVCGVPMVPHQLDVAGYYHFGSSSMPHINRGLITQADGYWADRSYIGEEDDNDQ